MPAIQSCAQVIEWALFAAFLARELEFTLKAPTESLLFAWCVQLLCTHSSEASCTGALQTSVWGEVGTIQVIGQPWFIPSASSILLSELLGQLLKYH